MYEDIYNKLIKIKDGADSQTSREMLLSVIRKIESFLLEPENLDHTTFAGFVRDEKFVFPVEYDDFTDKLTAVRTPGLFSEILGDLPSSNKLKRAILDLHSKLSRGIVDNEDQVANLMAVLGEIESKIKG